MSSFVLGKVSDHLNPTLFALRSSHFSLTDGDDPFLHTFRLTDSLNPLCFHSLSFLHSLTYFVILCACARPNFSQRRRLVGKTLSSKTCCSTVTFLLVRTMRLRSKCWTTRSASLRPHSRRHWRRRWSTQWPPRTLHASSRS